MVRRMDPVGDTLMEAQVLKYLCDHDNFEVIINVLHCQRIIRYTTIMI